MPQIKPSALRLSIVGYLTIVGIAMNSLANADCVDSNTCFGTGALQSNTSGERNSAFGFEALTSNTSGIANTATGWWALRNNTSGHANAAYGVATLQQNTTGTNNTAVGDRALTRNTTGTSNTALGYTAMVSNTTGFGNTSAGDRALMGNVTGNYNTAIGNDSMTGNNAGELNTATGWSALFYHDADSNSAFGAYAMFGNPLHVGGTQNTAAGAYALYGNYGSRNTAIGYRAMVGTEEVFGSALVTVTGSDNTAVGMNALFNLTTGNGNTATGLNALYGNMTGLQNTASGVGALKNNSSGVRNVAFGYQAGLAVTGSDNITIGADNRGKAVENGVIRIGVAANQKKTFVAGIRGVTTGLANATAVFIDGNGQLGTIKSSREVKEDIQPMGDTSDSLACATACYVPLQGSNDEGSKPIQFGLIAEEVAEAFPELVVTTRTASLRQ